MWRVGPDRRATGCRVIRSSGNAVTDDYTCRFIERKAVYAPIVVPPGKSGEQMWDSAIVIWPEVVVMPGPLLW